MARKSLPKDVETAVLTKSRRRCAICFGLDRDVKLKAGQIAHLDKSNSNNSEANLAFLCLQHHDEYDSVSSQRKNFTINEVKAFRDELYQTVGKALTQQVHFGVITLSPNDPYAGTYVRTGSSSDSAELKLTPLPDSYEGSVQYYLSGLALFGAWRESGPNLGIIEDMVQMHDAGIIVYTRSSFASREDFTTTLAFNGDGSLSVTEEIGLGPYGGGVSFVGSYQRVP